MEDYSLPGEWSSLIQSVWGNVKRSELEQGLWHEAPFDVNTRLHPIGMMEDFLCTHYTRCSSRSNDKGVLTRMGGPKGVK